MIRSFRDKDTRALYDGRRVRQFESFRVQAERRLQILDSVTRCEDLLALPAIGSRFWAETEKVSIVFALTSNGGSASSGGKTVLTRWRSWTATDRRKPMTNNMRPIHPGEILRGEMDELGLSDGSSLWPSRSPPIGPLQYSTGSGQSPRTPRYDWLDTSVRLRSFGSISSAPTHCARLAWKWATRSRNRSLPEPREASQRGATGSRLSRTRLIEHPRVHGY